MKSIVVRPAALLIGTAMLAATFVTDQAYAQTAPEGTHQMVVRYSDLNLEQPEGVKRLYRRIKSAAEVVCNLHRGFDLALLPVYNHCMSNAISNAVESVHSAQLRDLYAYDTQHGRIG
jgi:UrcA family protein